MPVPETCLEMCLSLNISRADADVPVPETLPRNLALGIVRHLEMCLSLKIPRADAGVPVPETTPKQLRNVPVPETAHGRAVSRRIFSVSLE